MPIMECSVHGCIKQVFSNGLCARHYEIKRVDGLPLCKVDECEEKSSRAGFCGKHYREQLKKKAPLCKVDGCGRASKSKGLCDAHGERLRRHGSLDVDAKCADRGIRSRHHLYERWKTQNRYGTLCDEWRKDFWKMVKAVGDAPSKNHVLRRKNTELPMADGNWYWCEYEPCENRAEYARKWRKNNRDKSKSSNLKKQFGINIETYKLMLDLQNGVCAICGCQEIARAPSSLTARDLAVDHDHATGKVRGLVCSSCNFVIGAFEKKSQVFERIIAYLKKHE